MRNTIAHLARANDSDFLNGHGVPLTGLLHLMPAWQGASTTPCLMAAFFALGNCKEVWRIVVQSGLLVRKYETRND